jgi:predicted DNA-binding transcriptional regulator AlpA
MARKVLRRRAVLEATGWSKSTLYSKIASGVFPRGTRIDPEGRVVIWFDDQVERIQERAVAALDQHTSSKNSNVA